MRTIHYGVGAMGALIATTALARRDIEVVAAFDSDPAKLGQDLGSVVGEAAIGVTIADPAVGDWPEADVVLHATVSSLDAVLPQLTQALTRGLDVVSICEELSFAYERPELAARLDALAREHGATLLATGVNPGFAMDTLPIVLSAVSNNVESVTVTRVLDAAQRRLPFQQKVGVGMALDEFNERVATGGFGHIGLRESAAAIAHAFGWEPFEFEHSLKPVIAGAETGHEALQPGDVAGICEELTLKHGGAPLVTMKLTMAAGVGDSRDEVEIAGDPPVQVHAIGGFHGDRSTAGIAVNAVRAARAAAPGYYTMRDLPPVHWTADEASGGGD